MDDQKNSEIIALLEKQSEENQELLRNVRQIRKYLAYSSFVNFLKFFLILAPIIIGFIYLPSLLDQWYERVFSVWNLPN